MTISERQCTDCGKPYTFVDGVSYCEDCTTAMTGLSESELVAALSAPPRPLQPGDKVLVEGTIVEGEIEGDGRSVVRFDKHGLDVLVSLSSIRPFPQEEPDHAN